MNMTDPALVIREQQAGDQPLPCPVPTGSSQQDHGRATIGGQEGWPGEDPRAMLTSAALPPAAALPQLPSVMRYPQTCSSEQGYS